MLNLNAWTSPLPRTQFPFSEIPSSFPAFATSRGLSFLHFKTSSSSSSVRASESQWSSIIQNLRAEDAEISNLGVDGVKDGTEISNLGVDGVKDGTEEFASTSGFKGLEEEKSFDKDPEFANILGSVLDDPQKAQSKMEERLRRKRNKILQTKTGSAEPMKVTFNKFSFSNSYIWFEFYNSPLDKDVNLICDTIRSWHIVGRLGGCNSMNMQLSQSPLDKRPNYDPVQGANVNPTTFYNIGDLEMQDNLARIWVDIGTSEPLLLDILINALIQISSDYIGIKQVMFGGKEFESWKENLKSEDAGFSVHKI